MLARSITISPIKTTAPRRPLSYCGQLIAAVVIIFAIQLPARSDVHESVALENPAKSPGHRNERSTPRASVLPASPAIARDRDHSDKHLPVSVAKAVLFQLGYPVGRLDDRITAKFKAALFQYQQTHGLMPSGNLDHATLRSLGITAK